MVDCPLSLFTKMENLTFNSRDADTSVYWTYVDNERNGLFKKYNDGKPYVVGHWKPKVGLIGKVCHYRNEKLVEIEYRDTDGKILSTETPPKSHF